MKRFHVHVAVSNLDQSIRFYSTLFRQEPTVQKIDYAKWMLDDPRVNFAISTRGHEPGVNHLGFQLESEAELSDSRARLQDASVATLDQEAVACCYAKSDKYWVTDPQGIAWETFRTLGDVPVYGEETRAANDDATCCVPLHQSAKPTEVAKGACCVPASPVEGKAACCG